ncbi:DUF1642 domain-containing protein [Streptococcus suis]|nr:DUF1642 domain-containing protein [Streptococcus suis]
MGFGEAVAVRFDRIVSVINQIHEPQKVVVPKHIADKIEYCKDTEGYGLFHAMDYCYNYKDSAEWLEDNQETFAKAWLFGFEIEQEKLYTVEIPDPNGWYKVRCLTRRSNGKLCIDGFDYKDILLETRAHFTESEIKQDFDWAWQFAKEVE